MLERFNGKEVKIHTTDGSVFTGTADSYPSGYGLHEFGREEESLGIGGVQIFKSNIMKIEVLTEAASDADAPAADPRQYDDLMGKLLEGSYYILDNLPEQVPAYAPGQYFDVERYFLQPERGKALRRKYAEIFLRLNCYDSMAVTFDSCMSWEKEPDPEAFAGKLADIPANGFFRAVFEAREAMIDLDPCDTSVTVYGTDPVFLERVRKLAEAEGLFMWQPPQEIQQDGSCT